MEYVDLRYGAHHIVFQKSLDLLVSEEGLIPVSFHPTDFSAMAKG